MKKIINIALVLALVLNLFTICASATDTFEFSLTADKESVKAGETVTLTVEVTNVDKFVGAKLQVQYNKDHFNKPAKADVIANPNSENTQINVVLAGKVTLVYANATMTMQEGVLATIPLVAKADVAAVSEIKLVVDPDEAGIAYSPSGVLVDDNGAIDKATTTAANSEDVVSVTVGEVAPPAFTVTANDNGTDTVVTVANKGDKTGKVYVATFVGGVLDVCQVKDLADGTLTFEGLTGDVKVYVWDANMVPLLDTALDA